MHVQPAARVGIQDRRPQQPHVPGGDDRVDPPIAERSATARSNASRPSTSFGSRTTQSTPWDSARSIALTPGRSDRTRAIRGPQTGWSRSACRFVPEPETSTAIRSANDLLIDAATLSEARTGQAVRYRRGSRRADPRTPEATGPLTPAPAMDETTASAETPGAVAHERCVHHPGRAAVARCSACEEPICLPCAVPVRGRVVGPECLAAELGDPDLRPLRRRSRLFPGRRRWSPEPPWPSWPPSVPGRGRAPATACSEHGSRASDGR